MNKPIDILQTMSPLKKLLQVKAIHSPGSIHISLIISQNEYYWFTYKHKLIELNKIIEEKIGSLIEEVEIATNVKLNTLYIADRQDEIEFVRWAATVIKSILNREDERKQVQLGTIKMRLE